MPPKSKKHVRFENGFGFGKFSCTKLVRTKKVGQFPEILCIKCLTYRSAMSGRRLAVLIHRESIHLSQARDCFCAVRSFETLIITCNPRTEPTNQGLPAGWDAAWDAASGAYYYFETGTGRVQWERPNLAQQVVMPARSPSPVFLIITCPHCGPFQVSHVPYTHAAH